MRNGLAVLLVGLAFTLVARAEVLRDKTRHFQLEAKYLNFPVKNGVKERLVSVTIDGQVLREFSIELAPLEPDFWVFLDVSAFRGKKASVRVDELEPEGTMGFDSIFQADTFPGEEELYREKLRAQLHFSSRRGWNNDPNGMVYYDGEYHLFYQHNPYGWNWGNMTWGHAVSKDLSHWTELGDAIHPDRLGTIFSGSAVVDEKNTAGFQTGDEKVIVCFYTSAGGRGAMSKGQPFTQSMAYSNDRGRTFTVFEGNPIIEHIQGSNRDPKVIWHDALNKWVMALYLEDGVMAFFSSEDLKSWEFHSKLKSFHECPELFELPVDGDENNKRWIFYGGSGDYLVGAFDGKEFKPETEAVRFHSGDCFYASQTFNNVPQQDGRRIQIAWGRVKTPGMPFNQMMLFPVTLTLRTTDAGVRMFAEPVWEIEKLHRAKHTWKQKTFKAGKSPLPALRGELFHIRAEFEPGAVKECGLVIRGIPVTYDVEKGELSCRDKKAALKPEKDRIRLELLVDRSSIEIFANDGRVYMPMGVVLVDNDRTLEVFSQGAPLRMNSLEVYELASIWQ